MTKSGEFSELWISSGKLWDGLGSSGEALWKLENTPKVLPATIGAQTAIVIRESNTLKNGMREDFVCSDV